MRLIWETGRVYVRRERSTCFSVAAASPIPGRVYVRGERSGGVIRRFLLWPPMPCPSIVCRVVRPLFCNPPFRAALRSGADLSATQFKLGSDPSPEQGVRLHCACSAGEPAIKINGRRSVSACARQSFARFPCTDRRTPGQPPNRPVIQFQMLSKKPTSASGASTGSGSGVTFGT